MAANLRHVELAKSLPPTLLRFFARHPPSAIQSSAALATPNSAAAPGYERPFEVTKNEGTGKYRNPTYSLRRQADLAKLADEHGVAELLPFTVKTLEARRMKREREGLRVKGTGVGQKVKGHWWERTLFTRLEARRQAMRDMPKLIKKWKKSGRGARWVHWPK